MAKSFWSKRTDQTGMTTGYNTTPGSVSGLTGLLLTIAGILLVGGLLFGVFNGAKWAYNKIAGTDSSSYTAVDDNKTITATSSTSTGSSTGSGSTTPATTPATAPIVATAPSTPATSTTSTTSAKKLPQTGPNDWMLIFAPIFAVSVLAYRGKLLKNQ
jgi:hypothetical protein